MSVFFLLFLKNLSDTHCPYLPTLLFPVNIHSRLPSPIPTLTKNHIIGVAMGNANDEVKAVADYVTDDVDHDGIMNALLHFGILQ